MFNENVLEYEEIKKLRSIKARKEYVSVVHGRIEQEEVIECKVNYCEVNYEYEHTQEVDCIKSRPLLTDCGYIVCKLIEDKKAEFCETIEDREVEKVAFCEAIEYQEAELIEKVVFCEEIED